MVGPIRSTSRFLHGITLLAYLAPLLVMGSTLSTHFGFPLDDSWIHQSVARNFANFGSLGYLPHERSSGSTSLLWTLILSGNYSLLPGLSPVIYTVALNVGLLLASGLLLLRIGLRDGLEPVPALLLAAAPALDGNYVWLAFTGMEHLLFVTLSLGSILLWLGRPPGGQTWGRALASGLCMGLLAMTRPEAVVLPFALFAAGWFFPGLRRFSLAQTGVAAAIVLALAAMPVAVNLYTSHSVLPVTFKGRQFLFANTGGPVVVRGHLLAQWLSRPFKAVMSFDGLEVGRAGQAAMLLTFIGFAALASVGMRELLQQRRWLTLSVCAWATLHALSYAVALPASGHGGRYQPLFLALTLPLPALGLAALLRKHTLLAKAVPAAALVLFGCVSLLLWREVLARGIEHIDRTHGVVATWLATHLPTETLAVFDIGRIGYERGTRGDPGLIDLGGLTDPRYIDFLQSGRVAQYLAARGVRYLVLPVDSRGQSKIGRDLGLMDVTGVHRRQLFRVCNTDVDWQIPWSETRNAFQCQEVDEVDFARGS